MSHQHTVYELSAKGAQELRGGKTTLSPLEVELLVRIDGQHTLTQLRDDMPTVDPDAFATAFYRLRDLRLISVVEIDPFESRFHADMDEMALALVGPEADAGTASLRSAGYYVSIARPRRAPRPRDKSEKPMALVVEDDKLLSKFVESYLTLDGYQVRKAANRVEVVTELRKLPIPDIVLLDITLPDVDGFDILLRLRQHPVLKEVCVIMLTGKTTREDVLKGLACGADGYVTKPFEADVLMRAIHTVTGLEDSPPSRAGPDLWTNADAKTKNSRLRD